MDSNTQTPQSSWEQLPDTGTHFKIGPDLWVYQRSAAPFPLPETWPDHPTFQANKAAKVKADSLAKAEPSPQPSAAPIIADKPTAQPTLEWNDGAQPRSHFVPPPAVPLAASPAKPVAATPSPLTMALPPSMVMANNSKEIATEPPRDIGTTPAPKPIVARDASPEASDPWAKFPEVDAKSATEDDPWAKFPIHEPTHAPALNWSDVPGQMLRNAPASAANLAANLVQPILHPIDTAKSLSHVVTGLTSKAVNSFRDLEHQDPMQRADDESTVNGIGSFLNDRYGSVEGIKHSLATDPIGMAADAAGVLTGGGALAGRVPGLVGQAGRVLSTAGSMVDPIRAVGQVVSRSGNLVADALGTTTGAGARPVREAFQAGRTGNQAFTDNMRGNVPVGNVVDMAENAVGGMGRDRAAQYRANMDPVRQSQANLDYGPIDAIAANAHDTTHYQGIPISTPGVEASQQIANIIDQFKQLPGPATPERFDAMKRALNEVRKPTQQGTLERNVTQNVYNGVRDEIQRQVPEYAHAMTDYSNMSDLITEMRRTMSISDKAMPDTTLRKLQSTMRNNVNTNYGARERLLDEMATHEPNLPAALAGQSLNSWAPRGLARIGPIPMAAMSGLATMNPMSLAALPFSSPRVVGEGAFAAGRVARSVGRAGQAAGVTPQRMQNAYLASLAARVPFAAMGATRPQTDDPRQRRGMGLTQPSR